MSRFLHLRTVSDGASGRPRLGPSRVSAILLLGATSSVVAAFGLPIATVSAASAPRANAPRASVFCGYAANASKSTSISSASLNPTSIQASFSKLKSEESFVLGNSPSQLKPDFVTLFTYLNKFISVLASVKYNYLKLTPTQLKTFATANTKQVTAATKAINSYLTNTCHVKISTTT